MKKVFLLVMLVAGILFGNGERTGNVDIVTVALNMVCHGEYVPGPCTHRPSHHESRGDPKSVV